MMAAIKLGSWLIVATLGSLLLLNVATLSRGEGLSALEEKSKRSAISALDISDQLEIIEEGGRGPRWQYERAKELKQFMETHKLDSSALEQKSNVDNMVELGEIDDERCMSNKLSHLDAKKRSMLGMQVYVDYHRKQFASKCAPIVLNKFREEVNKIEAQQKDDVENLFYKFKRQANPKCRGRCDFRHHELELALCLEQFLQEKQASSSDGLTMDNLYKKRVIGPCYKWIIATHDLQPLHGKIGEKVDEMMTAEFDLIVNGAAMCKFIWHRGRELLNRLRPKFNNKPPVSHPSVNKDAVINANSKYPEAEKIPKSKQSVALTSVNENVENDAMLEGFGALKYYTGS